MSTESVQSLLSELDKLANPDIAGHSKRFFKSGPGEYGEGDRFLGIRVPPQRQLARKYRNMSLNEIEELLQSPWHEVRLTALFILVQKYEKSDDADRDRIYRFYIDHLDRVNNWDLVDSSAKKIAGRHLLKRDRSVLYGLARSESLWERRTAIIATHYFIDHGDFEDTYRIALILMADGEDLIHKAAGWMIREAGRHDRSRMEQFLQKNYHEMPRTMLRYAIEHLPERKRQQYLKGTI